MSRKLFVINNPTSGGRRTNQKKLRELRSFTESNGLQAEFHSTTFQDNAQKIIQEQLDASFTELVVVGGDGTLNEAVNGLTHNIPLSIIPAGTGNDFIKNTPIKSSMESQFSSLLTGSLHAIDLGLCNDRKFINGVGIGFDGQIVEDMNGKKVPILRGHAKYYYHVLQILGSYKARTFNYSVKQQSVQENLILMTVGNGTTFGGGFKLMPNAKIDDGLLEVCTIGNISPLRRFLNIHRLSNGTHGSMDEVNYYQTTEITIKENDRLFAHIDGEQMGQPPYRIKILPSSIQLRI